METKRKVSIYFSTGRDRLFHATSYEYTDTAFVVTEDPKMLGTEQPVYEAKDYTYIVLANVDSIRIEK